MAKIFHTVEEMYAKRVGESFGNSQALWVCFLGFRKFFNYNFIVCILESPENFQGLLSILPRLSKVFYYNFIVCILECDAKK